jgi:hypothetical protein
MKIYKNDGTFIDNATDTDFGWNINDIIIDESISFYENANEHLRKYFNLSRDIIEIQEPASVEINVDLQHGKTNKIENMNTKIPPKDEIVGLINPCTIESKMLLSVIHFAMYKNFNRNMISFEDFRNSNHLKFLTGVETAIRDGIQNYQGVKNNNAFSLVMDLFLTETECDVTDFTPYNRNMFTDYKDSDTEKYKFLCQKLGSHCSEILRNVDTNIERICEETSDLRLQVYKIKESFEKETLRLVALIKSAQLLEKDLREVKFLDNLIDLLNGKLSNVVLKESPFRILLRPSNRKELNLII